MIDKIIRTILVLSLFLLYWSSDLLEKDVKSIKRELKALHEDVLELVRISHQQKIGSSLQIFLFLQRSVY